MADTAVQQDVTLNLGVKTDADIAKPMKDLASASARAAEGQKLVQERLDGITARLKSTADTAGMFNKVLGKSFGFENVEVGIKQITNRINDSVFRLKGQMEHFKISGDATPMLRSLQAVQGQVKKLQDQSKLGIVGAMAGGREAMGGVHSAIRGAMMFSAGDESLEKTFQTLMKFQGVTDVFSGLGHAVHGTVSGLVNYTRHVKAAAAANAAITAVQGITGAGGAAGAAGGAAGGAGLIGKFAPTLGALAGAAPIATAIGAASVALVGVGAASVLASDRLTNYLGKALYNLSDAAKHTAERIQEAEDQQRMANRRAKYGLGVSEEADALAAQRRALRQPLEHEMLSLREQRAVLGDTGRARARFPDQPFAAADQHRRTVEMLERQLKRAETGREDLYGGRSTGPAGLPRQAAQRVQGGWDRQELLRQMQPAVSPESQRGVAMAQAAEQRAKEREAEATRHVADVERRRRLGGLRSEYATNAARIAELGGGLEGGEIGALKRRLQAEQGLGRSGQYGVMAFEPTREAGNLGRQTEAKERELAGLLARQQTLQPRIAAQTARGLGADNRDATDADVLSAREAQTRQMEEARKATQATTAEIHRQNVERIDGLKKTDELLAAQGQRYRDILNQQRAQLEGIKEQVAFMDPEKKGRILAIQKRLEAGGELTPDQLEFALQHKDIVGPEALRKLGERRLARDPLGREVVRRQHDVHANIREAQAGEAETAQARRENRGVLTGVQAADARIIEAAEIKMQGRLEAAVDQIAQRLVKAMTHLANSAAEAAVVKAQQQQQGNGRAGHAG